MFSIIEDRLCDLQIEAESKIDKLKDLEKSKQASEDEVRKKQHVLQYIVGASDWCLANLD
jgi:ribosome recycling factor